MKAFYESKGIVLYQGDCLEVIPQLETRFDMMLTDPPYMIGAASVGNGNAKSGRWADMMNSAFWYKEWINLAVKKMNINSVGFIFTNWRSIPTLFKALYECGVQVNNLLVWDKEWIGPAAKSQFRPTYELVIYFTNGDIDLVNRSATDIMRHRWMAGNCKTTEHPAEKPVPLFRQLISEFNEAKSILDPFAGSGTTAIACLESGRQCILIEHDERYCEIIAKRIEKHQTQQVLF